MPAIEYPALEHALIQDSMVVPASLLMLLTRILPCALSTQHPLYDQPAGTLDTDGNVEDVVDDAGMLLELEVAFVGEEAVIW